MADISPRSFKSAERTLIQYSKQSPKCLSTGVAIQFELKDYCPAAFRYLQELDHIDHAEYALSIRAYQTLSKISLQVKSGSLLLLPHDGRFVIKCLKKNEVKALREMLPHYIGHVKRYRDSLLAKLYGLHALGPDSDLKVYFVVMRNVLRSDFCLHRCYDLKGSSRGRTLSKSENLERTIFKDIDFDFHFFIDPLIRHQLLKQIKYDCEFLEAEGNINYSLLIGIHIEDSHGGSLNDRSLDTDSGGPYELLQWHNNLELSFSHYCERSDRPTSKFGAAMPVRAIQLPRHRREHMSYHGGMQVHEHKALLYFGIIDILQGYTMRKRLEHAYKSIKFDSKSISAVNPRVYSARFQDFMCRVFLGEDLGS